MPSEKGIDWHGARVVADSSWHKGRRGHLATITSHEEMQFFLTNLASLGDAMNDHYWLGGYRASLGGDPAASWRWVTGEGWGYTNWSDGEPNNLGDNERCVQFWTWDGVLGRWNDSPGPTLEPGFVIEFSVPGVNCPSDWDEDGTIAPKDIAVFVQDWLASVARGDLHADYDVSGVVDSADVNVFVMRWLEDLENGC